MKLSRRRFLRLAAVAAAVPFAPHAARAQAYPTRPVRMILGFPAGGGPDTIARLLGQRLSERLGQQVILENRPGAGSNIATEAVVRAPGDGYTLLLATISNAINATLYEKLNFDFVRDIIPVASIYQGIGFMVVNPSLPAKNLSEFISYAKANPGKINMASGGNGSPQHIYGELFKSMTGVNMVHVPYRGGALALTDLIGGQVQVMFSDSTALEHIRAGRLRPFAVTSATRSETLPAVPTVGEFVPGYEAGAWIGVGAPRNTPTEVVERINKEINIVLADPTIKARLADLSYTVLSGTPADFAKFIAEETEKWGKVVKFAGLKPE